MCRVIRFSMRRGALVVLLVASAWNTAQAQPSNEHGFVYGGLLSSWQQGVTDDQPRTYLTAPGGWTAGLVVGGGLRVIRLLSVGGELRRTGLMEAVEPSRYFTTYQVQRRDTSVGAGVRMHIPLSASAGVALEPVVLFDVVHERSWLGSQVGESRSAPISSYVNSWGHGFAVGTDVRLGPRRNALMPGFRFQRMSRGIEAATRTWPGGESNWAVSLTVAWRVEIG
jgi:hypothetical protein